jgi:hypothetical protein
MKGKKRWSDLGPAQRAMIVVLGAAELVSTTVAARDLARRPAAQVRGPRLLWWPLLVVQPFGPLLYLKLGRVDADEPAADAGSSA